jgi:hypothetical protein
MSRLRNEDGSALLLAMTLTLMVAGAGAAAVLTARMETLLAGSFTQAQQALSVAEGGLARAIQELSAQSDWSPALAGVASTFTDGGTSGARQLPGGAFVVLCCGGGSLTADLQLRALAGRTWGANTPQWRLYAWGAASSWLTRASASIFYVVVWVADDAEDGDGDPSSDSNGTILLHALALGPNGARRSLHATVRHARGEDGLPLGRDVAVVSTAESRW